MIPRRFCFFRLLQVQCSAISWVECEVPETGPPLTGKTRKVIRCTAVKTGLPFAVTIANSFYMPRMTLIRGCDIDYRRSTTDSFGRFGDSNILVDGTHRSVHCRQKNDASSYSCQVVRLFAMSVQQVLFTYSAFRAAMKPDVESLQSCLDGFKVLLSVHIYALKHVMEIEISQAHT